MRTGRCLCGEVTYTLDGDPVVVAHCHCLDCQRTSGAGHSTGAVFPIAAVHVSGAVTEFEWKASAESTVTRSFCATCGSPLFGRNTRMTGYVTVTVGTLDDPETIVPQVAIFSRSRRRWDLVDAALPTWETQPAWTPEQGL